MEVVASFSQGRTAAAQCGLFTYKSVPVIFEPPCKYIAELLIIIYVYRNILNYLNAITVSLFYCLPVSEQSSGVTKFQSLYLG